jgi:hypothetical protein
MPRDHRINAFKNNNALIRICFALCRELAAVQISAGQEYKNMSIFRKCIFKKFSYSLK